MERSKMILIRISQIAFVVAAISLSSGCGSQPKLTKEARAGINSVSINTKVSMPENMFWGTASTGTVGGPLWLDITTGVISTVSEISARPKRERQVRLIYTLMMENDIIPGRMIVTQFKEQLKAKRVFPSIVETNGDATFTFEISSCGFMPRESNPFTPDPHRAVLMVDVCLEKPDGTLIWKNSATAQDHWLWPRLSRVNAFRYNDYIESPKLIRKSFDQAASQIVNQLLKKMEGN